MKNSILFKYLDINGANMMLVHSNLQFTNATKFNDPFDCHPNLIDFSNVPIKECGLWAQNLVRDFKQNSHERLRERAWICCLSKVHNSILMWSYYNYHKGVCIGLNMSKVAKYINMRHGKIVCNSGCEVQYRYIVEKPDYFRNATDFFHYQICTKAKIWKHEQEIRLFILDPSPRYMRLLPDQNDKDGSIDWKEVKVFPKIGGECFESIYLGINMGKREQEKIIKVAKKLNPDIKIYQMEINPNAFILEDRQFEMTP